MTHAADAPATRAAVCCRHMRVVLLLVVGIMRFAQFAISPSILLPV